MSELTDDHLHTSSPLHTRSAGGQSLPLALFVHGFPLDSRMWTEQLVQLADVRRSVAVDLRGFGESSTTSDPVTIEDHAHDLAALIRHLEVDAVDLVGLSMGGYVALALAELHPSLVRSLALVDTKATADTAEARQGRTEAIARLLDGGRASFVAGMVPNLLGPDPDPVVLARGLTMGESTPYETLVMALSAMRERPDRTAVLADFDGPVALIVGEHDGVTPPAVAEEMAEVAGDATLDVIAGAGHLSPMEAPAAVAEALRRHFARIDVAPGH